MWETVLDVVLNVFVGSGLSLTPLPRQEETAPRKGRTTLT